LTWDSISSDSSGVSFFTVSVACSCISSAILGARERENGKTKRRGLLFFLFFCFLIFLRELWFGKLRTILKKKNKVTVKHYNPGLIRIWIRIDIINFIGDKFVFAHF
jgi:hypothetical protein